MVKNTLTGWRDEETLPYDDYRVMTTRPSKIDPEAQIKIILGFKCPRCKTQLDAMSHGEEKSCWACRLVMQLWGNGLHCKL